MQPLAALGATRSRQGAGEAPSAPLPSISAFIPAARALPAAGRRRPERRSAGGEAERGGEQLPAPASEAGLGADPSGSASRAPPLNNAPPPGTLRPLLPPPLSPAASPPRPAAAPHLRLPAGRPAHTAPGTARPGRSPAPSSATRLRGEGREGESRLSGAGLPSAPLCAPACGGGVTTNNLFVLRAWRALPRDLIHFA